MTRSGILLFLTLSTTLVGCETQRERDLLRLQQQLEMQLVESTEQLKNLDAYRAELQRLLRQADALDSTANAVTAAVRKQLDSDDFRIAEIEPRDGFRRYRLELSGTSPRDVLAGVLAARSNAIPTALHFGREGVRFEFQLVETSDLRDRIEPSLSGIVEEATQATPSKLPWSNETALIQRIRLTSEKLHQLRLVLGDVASVNRVKKRVRDLEQSPLSTLLAAPMIAIADHRSPLAEASLTFELSSNRPGVPNATLVERLATSGRPLVVDSVRGEGELRDERTARDLERFLGANAVVEPAGGRRVRFEAKP